MRAFGMAGNMDLYVYHKGELLFEVTDMSNWEIGKNRKSYVLTVEKSLIDFSLLNTIKNKRVDLICEAFVRDSDMVDHKINIYINAKIEDCYLDKDFNDIVANQIINFTFKDIEGIAGL